MKLKLHSKIFINIGVIVLMTILQYKIFNSIEFENLENNLTILLCIINPIAIIISGIISGKEIKKIFLIQLIIPMIPAIVYYNIFEKITNTILIYLWIYIGIEIWIILTNTLVKNKKIKVLLNVILSIILILNVFISRETLIKNCKSNIKNKYEICTGKLSEVYDKYMLFSAVVKAL